jgi:hypothetical protein
MHTLTAPALAAALREIADQLDAAPAGLALDGWLRLKLDHYSDRSEADRIADVDMLADCLGLNPSDEERSGAWWEHRATDRTRYRGFLLDVGTQIAGPRRCACGATCTHATAVHAA